MWFIFAFIVLVPMALVTVGTVELMYDTDYLPNARYLNCLHYTNEFTNTHSIKYCIQPEIIADYQKRFDQSEQTQCTKGAITHSFSSLFEKDINPSTVLSTFRSGIEQADQYGAYFFHRKVNDYSVLIDDYFICK
jgi:hypothetical protein